jgi:hypothetical protein
MATTLQTWQENIATFSFWWSQIVITTAKIYMVRSNCDNTTGSWWKAYFNKDEFRGVKGLSQQTTYLWRKPIATFLIFMVKGLLQHSYIWWRQMVITTSKIFLAWNNCENTDNLWRMVYAKKLNVVTTNGYHDG